MDEERILNKISELEKYLAELKEVLPKSVEIFLDSIKDRRAVERILQISIETVIDICVLLIKEYHLGPPKNEENILDLLKGKIPDIDKLKEMKGFRNFLVHRYDTINYHRVFNYAMHEVSDIEAFIQIVKKILKEKK